MQLSPNESYLFDRYEREGGCGLDYGCGDGKLVAAARDRGYEFYGVERYYGSTSFKEESAARTPAAARGWIEMLDEQDQIPFSEGRFDFVCSNSVLEHVESLEMTVSELARVTKPGGSGLHLFPTREIVREPHLGVPYYHRVPKLVRRRWAWMWHRVGFATFSRDQPDYNAWYADLGTFYDTSVYLRPVSEVLAALSRDFDVLPMELDKLSFHIGRRVPDVGALRLVEHRRAGVAVWLRRL